MKKSDILKLIKELAGSQGFYSRMYHELTHMDKADRERCLQFFENKNFKTDLDFILYIEG